jgi:hypothetical protein
MIAVRQSDSFELGTRADGRPFRLAPAELATHMAVLGTTGSGKSRLLWKLLREHRRLRCGFCLIDPGDLADDFLADVAREAVETGNANILKKIHLLELSPFCCARFDPFRFHLPKVVHPELLEAARKSWQHTKVQSVAEVFQRKQGQVDFEGMPRLQRGLTNVLTAVSTLVDGRRLAPADAAMLLDLNHAQHDAVYRRLASSGRLPREIVADFETIHAFKRVQDLRTETESTLNRLRSLLGPLMKQTLSATGAEPALDLYHIVQRGDYLIVKVAETPFASHDQNVGLAGLVIHHLFETMLVTPRELRRSFSLLIDEAGEYGTSPDIARALGVMRKYGLSMVLAAQDLSSFRKKDFDMTPKVLSQCGSVICFSQKWPEDTEIMARVLFGGGNIDFTALVQEVERHDGYDWHSVSETSEGTGKQRNWSDSTGTGTTESEGTTESASRSRQTTKTKGKTSSSSRNSSTTAGDSESSVRGGSSSQSPIILQGDVKKMLALQGTTNSSSSTQQSARTSGDAYSDGTTETTGESDGTTTGTSRERSQGRSTQQSRTDGGGDSESRSVSQKLVPLARIVREKQRTGSLERSVSDQLEEFRQTIQGLRRRQAVALTPQSPRAIVIETAEVKDPFVSAGAQAKAVDWVKRELLGVHPYLFVPALDAEEEERRLRAFTGEVESDDALTLDVAPEAPLSTSDDERDALPPTPDFPRLPLPLPPPLAKLAPTPPPAKLAPKVPEKNPFDY